MPELRETFGQITIPGERIYVAERDGPRLYSMKGTFSARQSLRLND